MEQNEDQCEKVHQDVLPYKQQIMEPCPAVSTQGSTVKFNEVSVVARSALNMASESHCGLA